MIEKVVKKTHAELKKKHKQRGGVLHCYRENPITRSRLLKRIAEKDCAVMTVYIDKQRVYTKFSDEKDIFYNYVANILLDRVLRKRLIDVSQSKKVVFIASRKETSRFLNENFKRYLKQQTQSNHGLDISVEIRTPSEEKALQAVDFISWAIFRKQEHGDDTYYNLIREKIVEENPLFP